MSNRPFRVEKRLKLIHDWSGSILGARQQISDKSGGMQDL